MKHLTTAAVTAILSLSLYACAPAQSVETTETPAATQVASPTSGPKAPFKSTRTDGLKEMIVAGGCFWCTESDFEKVPGVVQAVAGYTGGTLDNPSYQDVITERTGHREAVKVVYDPTKVTYRQLIDHYWKTVDPTDAGGQFCDRGESYTTAIYVTPDERAAAEASKAEIEKTKPFAAPIVTPILPAVTFYDAETYHQGYYKKNTRRYERYRKGCGRDARTAMLWGAS